MFRILMIVLSFLYSNTLPAQQVFNKKLKLMGSRFDISVVDTDSIRANEYIQLASDEITRIEKIISSWNENSETSKINRNSGIKPVKVSTELFELIERSLTISKLTDGAFDISYASMDNIWKFDDSMKKLPTQDEINKSVEKVGYENIELNKELLTVYLKIKGMKIGFGAIGKGYAADKAKKLLISKEVKSGIINASGDMNTWGQQPNGENWNIAITNPMNKKKAFAILPIPNGAVVTSGNYEKFVTFNDIRYSHIINPKTGMPSTGIISVSVFASSAELADALATSIFVMGSEVGINRINQIPNVDCIVIDDKGNIHTSKNININEK